MRQPAACVAPFALILATACGDPSPTAPPTPTPRVGAYLGQGPPGLEPEPFAPGLVSTAMYERDLAWTPDGGEAYWTVYSTGHRAGAVVAVRRRVDGADGWIDATPLPPPIASPALDFCPALSPDGRVLFFTSTRTTFELTTQATYGDLADRLSAPGNGRGDLWWVDVRALDPLRTN